MKPPRIRQLRAVLPILLAGALAALLAATIYWTAFDPRWIVFLGGVLLAAILATASRASHAEWRVARRTRQLERERAKLALEVERSRRSGDAFVGIEMRLRALGDAVTSPVVLLDREQRCIFHNRAVEEKTQLPGDRIHGSLLRDVVGAAAYEAMRPYVAKALSGGAASFRFDWGDPQAPEAWYVRQISFPSGPSPVGVCLVLSAAPKNAARASGSPVEREEPLPGARGEALYLRAIAGDQGHWNDPRARLVQALEQDQFLLLGQEIVPLKPALAEQSCCEVLLRLREEEENLLPPGSFLPIAERSGMMEDIDRWVVRHLISRCLARSVGESGWHPPLYCVNVSAAALGSPGFARFVQKQLVDRSFDGRRLCFEIAEPDLVRQRADAERFIGLLKPSGCRFTVDAFGSTGTPFSAFKGLPVDFIKIDGIIVQNILRNPPELAKARAIGIVCQKLGILTIAEMVEDRATLEKLREIGIDYVQGFGVARPAPMQFNADMRQRVAAAGG